jgi:NitT/TauT family transport system permease protein
LLCDAAAPRPSQSHDATRPAPGQQSRFHHRKGFQLVGAQARRHDRVMADALTLEVEGASRDEPRWRVIWRNAVPFILVAAIWEAVARAGVFPARLFPALETIAATFWRLTIDGILPHHALETLARLGAGFALAALISIGAPIPGLAYAPLFLLWFGLGNKSTVLLVGFVSAFPIIFNTWTGVKAVKDIWVRSAQAMGADNSRLFRHVILPGALPYILTGLRLGLAQAWRILVGVEMLAAVPWGLGWMIFGAREFLNMDVMLAGVAVIAIIGLALEKLVFQRLEQFTVVRWGMMT